MKAIRRTMCGCFFVLSIVMAGNVQAATIYVSPAGNDSNSGATWALAKQTIQAAAGISVADDIIVVANGVYAISSQISLPGGVWLTSQSGPAGAIILGNGTTRCVNMPESDAGLKGFTITGGRTASNGAGVYCYGGTVVDCTISNNLAKGDEPKGGGIYCEGSSISNCVVSGNRVISTNTYVYGAFVEGGGIYLDVNSVVEHCLIEGNTLAGYYAWGAGIEAIGGWIDDCTIRNNISYGRYYAHGGGIHMTALAGDRIRNCLIVGNNAHADRKNFSANTAYGGGVDINQLGGTIENCTISGNSVDGEVSYGGGLNFGDQVFNTILDGNTATARSAAHGPNYYLNSLAPATFIHCCTIPQPGGAGNITDNPQFANVPVGNYRLLSSSPCVNTGTNQDWMAGAVDLDGNMRIWNGTVDLGAYEYGSVPPPPPPPPPPTLIGPVIKANGSTNDISINSGANLSIAVQLDPGQYAGVDVDWWVVALANSSWYYLNGSMQWTQFDGNLSNCHPVHTGALFNLPVTEVLNMTGLPAGSYTFWFALDYPMDGILNLGGQILYDAVNVTVQ